MDLKTLTDEELDTLRKDVSKELERRQSLNMIPAQLDSLVVKYTADGGDVQVLVDLVSDPRHTEEA